MLLLIFCLTVAICYAVLSIVKVRRQFRFAKDLPGPKGIPILGVVIEFNNLNREERCNKMLEYAEQFPQIGRCWFGPVLLKLYVHDPDYIQKIYNSSQCLQKPDFYRFFGWGSGLVTADAQTWRTHRKLLNTAFTLKILQSFIPIFDVGSREFVRHIGKNVGKGEFNLLEYAVKATLDSICATSFGINIKAQENNHQFNKYLQRTHEIVSIRMFNIQFYSDLIFRMSRLFNEDKHVRQKCVEFGDELIENRRQIYQKHQRDINQNVEKKDEEAEGEFYKKPQIFVDHLLKMTDEGGRQFTESEIRDHVFTTISAGNETTALCVSYACLFLAIHPHMQDKVVEELKEVFPTADTEVDYDRIQKLTYLEMIIKETLRLCPSVPIIARTTLADVEVGGMIIPKGVDIIVNLFALHRRYESWGPDSKMFNPERFLPELVAKRHAYSYMPFSIGVRNCIGQKYAMISLKVMLINLLRAYEFKTHMKWEDVKWKFDIHLHITKPHSVEIVTRQFYASK